MRLGVLGDLHGNGPALESILHGMGTVDLYVGLGDYLYPSSGSFTIVDWIKKNNANGYFIRGNHDEFTGTWKDWRSDPSELFNCLAGFPTEQEFELEEQKFLIRHDYPVHPHFSVDGASSPYPAGHHLSLYRREYIDRYIDLNRVDVFIWGGFHLPYVGIYPDLILINPGAGGLTAIADDRSGYANYMILDVNPEEIVVSHRRASYDVNRVVDEVAQEYANGPPEESWLVRRVRNDPTLKARDKVKDWKTNWGQISIRRTPQGIYDHPPALWELVERTPPPSWKEIE